MGKQIKIQKILSKVFGGLQKEGHIEYMTDLLNKYFTKEDLNNYELLVEEWRHFACGLPHSKNYTEKFESIMFYYRLKHYDILDVANMLAAISKNGGK